jgi:hypothetical protein
MEDFIDARALAERGEILRAGDVRDLAAGAAGGIDGSADGVISIENRYQIGVRAK